jgi:putative ABC transport system permease protein
VDQLLQDVRYACRTMLRNKPFAAAALLTLALGIGASTAVFSLVYGVLLRPLPYPEPDGLVRLSEGHAGAHSPLRAALLSNLTYYAWNDTSRTLEGIAAYAPDRYNITGLAEPMRIKGTAVSPALFRLLRANPAAGRFFTEKEGADDAPVTVLSHEFWRQHFGLSPDVIGRQLTLEGKSYTVIGVTPPGFYFPDHETRLWVPNRVQRPEAPGGVTVSVFPAVARLRAGATTAQAAAEGTSASRGTGARPMVADMLFGTGGPVEIRVRTLADETTGRVRPALVLLGVGVGFVLLIACANVAHLFLSRGLSRHRELAVRAALGAGQARIVRQLLTEALVISVLGGVLGLGVGVALVKILPAVAPADFPRLSDVRVDTGFLIFAALLSIAAGLVSGIVPALRCVRIKGWGSIHTESRTAEGGFRGSWASRLRGMLLAAEAAVAVMLLVGAGLLVRSFERLVSVDAGFDAANVVTGIVYLPAGYTPEQEGQYVDSLLGRLRALPGIAAAGASNMAPFAGVTGISGFTIPAEGKNPARTAKALSYVVSRGYAEALSLRLREGRFFGPEDEAGGVNPMIVNQEFARQYLGTGTVAGRRFQGLMTDKEKVTEIIGVVGDVLKDGLDGHAQPEIYLLHRDAHALGNSFNIVIRTHGSARAMTPAIRGLVLETDKNAVIDELGPLAQRVSASVSQPRFATSVIVAFAVLALTLAAIGLYGVLSYNVTRRRRELGVRAALGATRGHLLSLVVGEGMAFVGTGLLVGLAGAGVLTKLMSSLLFGVSPLDAVSFLAAPVVLLAVALLACTIPAKRAASADPAEALRCE